MGYMTDLLITVHGGGEKAVAAVERMGQDWREQLEQAAAEIERRWIPVGERLPVDIPHGYCLVTDGENVGTANYSTTANKFDHCIDRDYWTPTHWMPLPEPPEVK